MTKSDITKIFRNPPILDTERLILRKIVKTDYPDMYEYSKRAEVTKYLLWSPHRDEEYTMIYPLIPDEYTELLDTLTAQADAGVDVLPEIPEDADYAFSRTISRCDEDVSFRIAEYYFVRLSKDGSGKDPVKETYLYNGDSGFVTQIPEEFLPAVDRMIDSLDLFDPLPWEW